MIRRMLETGWNATIDKDADAWDVTEQLKFQANIVFIVNDPQGRAALKKSTLQRTMAILHVDAKRKPQSGLSIGYVEEPSVPSDC